MDKEKAGSIPRVPDRQAMMKRNGCCKFILSVALPLVLALSGSASADAIKPFTTDGCSLFPNGTAEQKDLWLACCIDHDLAYWMGGTSVERERADRHLKECVAQAGEPDIARLMLAGVRVGGTPYLPTSFRWGYGWPWPRGYRDLSEDEWTQIKEMLGGKH